MSFLPIILFNTLIKIAGWATFFLLITLPHFCLLQIAVLFNKLIMPIFESSKSWFRQKIVILSPNPAKPY